MLDAPRGPETGSMYVIAPPERPYLDEVTRDPGKLKIAFTRRSPIGTPIDPEAVKAVEDTAKLLESLALSESDALANEFRHGLRSLREVAPGLERFRAGAGRHGSFEG